MHPNVPRSYTCFDGYRRLTSGSLVTIIAAAQSCVADPARGPILIFEDATGRSVDVDMRAQAPLQIPTEHIAAGVNVSESDTSLTGSTPAIEQPRRRGRPKLGVIPREVTLLPRHWEWLATQPGGASVALRKLVEEARRTHAETDRARQARERAYYFISAIAGDLPGFEEASRALFADDRAQFGRRLAHWPEDVRNHALALAFGNQP